MNKINICIVGCGNCCSSLLQGLQYYKDVKETDSQIPGIMHNSIGGYLISDIRPALAYDIDARKVGQPLYEAIFCHPNNTKIFCKDISESGVVVKMGKILDGFSPHLLNYDEKYRIVLSEEKEPSKEDIVRDLKDTKIDMVINYLPVGSQLSTEFYAQAALEANCAFINCIPVFISSNKDWAEKFQDANLPIIGDDVKSQIGATIVHRTLTQMILDRGAKIDSSYQLNVGGNTDFRNMLDQSRLKSKKISKTESISSQIPVSHNAYVYAGPNGCIDCLDDNKICHLRIDFRLFGNIPAYIDLKLSVEDSPNSAGVVIDAIRTAKICLDRKIGGPLIPACAYYMKHPPIQMREQIAREQIEKFISEDNL